MATADANKEFAKEAYRAIAGGDIAWLQEHTHPDVEIGRAHV